MSLNNMRGIQPIADEIEAHYSSFLDDLKKNCLGNMSAGRRARKCAGVLRNLLKEFKHASVDAEKKLKADKATA